VANQKEFFGECFKGDKTFPLIILLAKWVYQLVIVDTNSIWWPLGCEKKNIDLLKNFEKKKSTINNKNIHKKPK
jgi:hypothetical protein